MKSENNNITVQNEDIAEEYAASVEKGCFKDIVGNMLYSKAFRIGACIAVIMILLALYIMNRMIIVRIQYDIDGQTIDHSMGEIPNIALLDGGMRCFGFGKCMEDEKVFIGFDPKGVSLFRLEDTCEVAGIPRECCFDFSFPQNKKHFRDETLYIHFVSAENGDYTCSADCSNQKTCIVTINDDSGESEDLQ